MRPPRLPPLPPDADPLLVEIYAIAATLDLDELRVDIDDPAFVSLVDRAVAVYAPLMTQAGEDEARLTATMTLAGREDIKELMAKERTRLAEQGSGVQPVKSAARLAARRRRRTGSRP